MIKNPTYTQLPIDTQKMIKQKYMEGYSVLSLAEENKLIRQSLAWYIRNHNWSEERRLLRADLFQQFSDTKRAAFTGIYLDGTTLLRKAVSDAVKEYDNGDLSIKEKLVLAEQIIKLIKELDKIQRLDDGQPTEIKEDRPFSIEAVSKKLHMDPFYKQEIEDAEIKEGSKTNDK